MRVAVVLWMVLLAACAPTRHANTGDVGPRQSPQSAAPKVAITLDDLGGTVESSAPALSEQILRALAAHEAPVAVFANCGSLDPETLLLWQRAGATIGNHTTTHLSVDAAGPDETWWSDVKACDARLRDILREPVTYFRFPYLRYGRTPDHHAGAASKLASLGYSIAHVTAATSEWLLAGYYEEARKARDNALAEELARAYVDHMVESLDAARRLAVQRSGRDVAHITLAHVNQLAADHLGDVLQALRSRGWQFVTLQEALADPVYALPDVYVGGCGCSWLARIPPAMTRNDTYVFGGYEDQLRERFEQRVKALSEPRDTPVTE